MCKIPIKERLKAYVAINREIDNDIERLDFFETKMYGIGGQNLTGMPHNPSPDFDKIGAMTAKKEELEQHIKETIKIRDSERNSIKAMTRQLTVPDEKAVIKMKYLDMAEWPDISMMLFGMKDDFNDRYESYMRRVFKLHGSALAKMEEMQ